jgi:hypothetical protein
MRKLFVAVVALVIGRHDERECRQRRPRRHAEGVQQGRGAVYDGNASTALVTLELVESTRVRVERYWDILRGLSAISA